jgi:hypothetical protein
VAVIPNEKVSEAEGLIDAEQLHPPNTSLRRDAIHNNSLRAYHIRSFSREEKNFAFNS